MTKPAYPVRVTGRLDPELSRGLWLVKWLLLIPHLIVLVVLGVAFWVLTVVALVAILVTGRYPRAIFGFNLGVLRWGWRVAYYGYAANGTDRYPPFTLADVEDYPARLQIDRPPRLSRGLALVKWWLLAVPHYLVLLFLVGAGGTVVWRIGATGAVGFDGGLVSVLVLIGVVGLLFTGHYPRGLLELVLGLDRWVLRVIAYAALMTDEYPPFRLDQGGEEPAPPTAPEDTGRAATPSDRPEDPVPDTTGAGAEARGGTAVLTRSVPPVPAPPARVSAAVPPPGGGRSVLLAAGALLTALAVGLTAAGVYGLVLDRTGRDAAGFVASGVGSASTAGHALRSGPIRIDEPDRSDLLAQVVGDVFLQATSPRSAETFVGMAPSTDVARYLGGVAHGVWRGGPTGSAATAGRVDEIAGGAPAGPPAAQTFWVASDAGSGTRSLTWSPAPGDWTAVVMNADGSAPVTAQVRVGAQVPVLGTTSAAALGAGIGLLVIGVAAIAVGARPERERAGASR